MFGKGISRWVLHSILLQSFHGAHPQRLNTNMPRMYLRSYCVLQLHTMYSGNKRAQKNVAGK